MPEGSDLLGNLLSLGFGGLILALVLTKQLVPGYIYRKEQADKEDKEAQLKRLQDIHEEKVLPALYKSSEVLGKLVHEDIRLPGSGGG